MVERVSWKIISQLCALIYVWSPLITNPHLLLADVMSVVSLLLVTYTSCYVSIKIHNYIIKFG